MHGPGPYVHTADRYERLAAWLTGVRAYGIEADVFYVIDTSSKDDGRVHGDEYRPPASRGWKLPMAAFDAMKARIGPLTMRKTVGFEAWEEPPLCEQRPCLCRHNLTYPRWWEQVAKNERCLRHVEAAEASSGAPYDYLLKARAEYRWKGALRGDTRRQGHPNQALDYDGISVEAFLWMLSRREAATTWVASYNEGARFTTQWQLYPGESCA